MREQREKNQLSNYLQINPLENAVYKAVINLMSWMVEEYGARPKDAYIMISCIPEFKIKVYQMVKSPNILYVVGAEIPKKYLKK